MTEGVMFLPQAVAVSGRAAARQRDERGGNGGQPLAPWFLDNPLLRAARFEGTERERRERRFKLQLEKLMELFSSSQIEPAEFRERLIALMSSR